MSIRQAPLLFVAAIMGLVVPSAGAAAAADASHASPCFAPVAGKSERATWSSTSAEVVDYTEKLIKLNPKAGLVINGRTEKLTSPDNTTLIRPEGKVPDGVVFDFVED